jgi:Pyruvate/2-oxoacid:ferredoxin oxidoreductase gamma subunit
MIYKIIIAGLDGHNAMFAAKLLVKAAENSGYKAMWLPLQVSEMRGNNASCRIVLSDDKGVNQNGGDREILIATDKSAILRFAGKLNGIIITDERYKSLCGRNQTICLNTDLCGCGEELEGLSHVMMIGAMTEFTGIIGYDEIADAAEKNMCTKAAARVKKAVKYGREKILNKNSRREIV